MLERARQMANRIRAGLSGPTTPEKLMAMGVVTLMQEFHARRGGLMDVDGVTVAGEEGPLNCVEELRAAWEEGRPSVHARALCCPVEDAFETTRVVALEAGGERDFDDGDLTLARDFFLALMRRRRRPLSQRLIRPTRPSVVPNFSYLCRNFRLQEDDPT